LLSAQPGVQALRNAGHVCWEMAALAVDRTYLQHYLPGADIAKRDAEDRT